MPAAILRSIVESLLFVADGPLTLDRLCTVLEEYDRDLVRAALAGLVAEYEAEGRGIALVQVAGGFQFRTRPEHADYIRRLRRGRVAKFSQSALETLAERMRQGGATEVRQNAFLLRATVDGHEFTVFPDGRAIIKGADT